MNPSASWSILVLVLTMLTPLTPASAQLVRSAAGTTALSVTDARNTFRLDIGGGDVAGANGLFGGIRREINWDAVPATVSAPNNLPANFFNVNSPRGAVFATPGTGFQVSGATTDVGTLQPALADFGNINPSFTSAFEPFSPQRLFTALGSNIVDVNFFVPGTTTPALTSAFGSIFSDVDLPNTTSLQFFDSSNSSLGTFFVPNVPNMDQTFSFLGVSFGSPLISRVRITNGNGVLSAGTTPSDLVVMDDFIYAEPVAAVPDAGGTLVLLGVGLAGLLLVQQSMTAAASDAFVTG